MQGDMFWSEYLSSSPSVRTWRVELFLPRVEAVGVYTMTGSLPPNIDLGTSTGPERSGQTLGNINQFIFLKVLG